MPSVTRSRLLSAAVGSQVHQASEPPGSGSKGMRTEILRNYYGVVEVDHEADW